MPQEIPGAHFLGEVGQKVVLEREGKVLMCRGVGSDTWDIPGGRLHKGESPLDGLRRELREELGIEIVVKKPFYTCAVHDFKNQPPRYFVVYGASMLNPSDTLTVADDEIEEVMWISKEEIESIPTMEEWRKAIKTYFE